MREKRELKAAKKAAAMIARKERESGVGPAFGLALDELVPDENGNLVAAESPARLEDTDPRLEAGEPVSEVGSLSERSEA